MERKTLDLGAVGWSSMLGVDIALKNGHPDFRILGYEENASWN